MSECRNCKSEIKKGIRRCPYCGMLNPTLQVKEVYITIAIILVVMSIYTYVIN